MTSGRHFILERRVAKTLSASFYNDFPFQPFLPYVDFGTIVVGSSASNQIVFTNDGNCSLHYRLFIHQTINGPYSEEITRDDPCGKNYNKIEEL